MLLVRLPGSVTHARPPAPTSAFRAASKRAPVPLRLVAFRGGLGIELYEAQHLACFEVEELTWSLPGVGFPVDLSGGVATFADPELLAVAGDPFGTLLAGSGLATALLFFQVSFTFGAVSMGVAVMNLGED